ncbi:hypothetical protein DM790_15665 [Flavobacterium collinsii]|nr:hypothetical protein [Flavobacterium collinsii]
MKRSGVKDIADSPTRRGTPLFKMLRFFNLCGVSSMIASQFAIARVSFFEMTRLWLTMTLKRKNLLNLLNLRETKSPIFVEFRV